MTSTENVISYNVIKVLMITDNEILQESAFAIFASATTIIDIKEFSLVIVYVI